MRFNTVFALSGILLFAGNSIGAQTASRWLRLPHGSTPPAILRHHLGAPQLPGFTFQFSYETVPVKPLERLINRAIPEAAPDSAADEELPGAGQRALKLKELNQEAAELLANPPASMSFTHLFLQQQKKPENASQTENVASISTELPAENIATDSSLPPASFAIPASDKATIKATGTAALTATGATDIPALPAAVKAASDTTAGN